MPLADFGLPHCIRNEKRIKRKAALNQKMALIIMVSLTDPRRFLLPFTASFCASLGFEIRVFFFLLRVRDGLRDTPYFFQCAVGSRGILGTPIFKSTKGSQTFKLSFLYCINRTPERPRTPNTTHNERRCHSQLATCDYLR